MDIIRSIFHPHFCVEEESEEEEDEAEEEEEVEDHLERPYKSGMKLEVVDSAKALISVNRLCFSKFFDN